MEEYVYILEDIKSEVMKEPVEMIRGHLCDIQMAHREFDSARLESFRDR